MVLELDSPSIREQFTVGVQAGQIVDGSIDSKGNGDGELQADRVSEAAPELQAYRDNLGGTGSRAYAERIPASHGYRQDKFN